MSYSAASRARQISSDERKRVARVAEQFSEEDLARFLQIMLRTHDELGYRQAHAEREIRLFTVLVISVNLQDYDIAEPKKYAGTSYECGA